MARRDAEDPDPASVMPGQSGDEIESSLRGLRTVDGQQDAHVGPSFDAIVRCPEMRGMSRMALNGPEGPPSQRPRPASFSMSPASVGVPPTPMRAPTRAASGA